MGREGDGAEAPAEFRAIGELVATARRIAVVSHDRPDGDAIGSCVAFGLILESLGKEVACFNCDPVPESLRFLPEIERVRMPDSSFRPELVVALDAAGRDRIGETAWTACRQARAIVNIDHHVSNTRYGDVVLVDAGAPATGQIVFELSEALGWEIPPPAAAHLYAAISTDTGSFRFPSTTARTYRIAAALVDIGVDVGHLNRMLYENYPLRRVEAMRELLNGMRTDCADRCASVSLPLETTRRLSLQPGDTEGIVDVIRSIDRVEVAILFEELETGKIRVSTRAKEGGMDVGVICAEFGGGGHRLAAGARLPGPLDAAREEFLTAVARFLGRN